MRIYKRIKGIISEFRATPAQMRRSVGLPFEKSERGSTHTPTAEVRRRRIEWKRAELHRGVAGERRRIRGIERTDPTQLGR